MPRVRIVGLAAHGVCCALTAQALACGDGTSQVSAPRAAHDCRQCSRRRRDAMQISAVNAAGEGGSTPAHCRRFEQCGSERCCTERGRPKQRQHGPERRTRWGLRGRDDRRRQRRVRRVGHRRKQRQSDELPHDRDAQTGQYHAESAERPAPAQLSRPYPGVVHRQFGRSAGVRLPWLQLERAATDGRRRLPRARRPGELHHGLSRGHRRQLERQWLLRAGRDGDAG